MSHSISRTRVVTALLALVMTVATLTGLSPAHAEPLASTAEITVSKLYPHQGDLVVYRIEVACPGFEATGTVQIADGKALNETVALVRGAAEVWDIPPAGSYEIMAEYGGDNNCAAARTNLTLIVGEGDYLSLTSSANPSALGQTVTFTATSSCPYPMEGDSVDFYEGATLLGNAILEPDLTASIQVSTLTLGAHTITAVYVPESGSDCPFVNDGSMVQNVVSNPPQVLFPDCTKAFPNLGALIISKAQTQYGLWAPEKDAARRTDGTQVLLPIDAAGKGWDEYLIIDKQVVNNKTWYGIWVGGCAPVYVPADKVTVTRTPQ